jgi:hypothetical protein
MKAVKSRKNNYLKGKTFPLFGGTQSGKKRKSLPLSRHNKIMEI